MSHCPDFSDSDSSFFSDDPDYHDFKRRTQNQNKRFKQTHLTQAEKNEQDLNLLYAALCSGNKETVISYLENGIDVNKNIQDNWTPLLLAVSVGNFKLTEELIKRGADVNSRRDGSTALMMACSCPKETASLDDTLMIIKLLIAKGANVKAINRNRITALMFAANNGHLEAVKYILPFSDKMAEDNQGWTALFWAVNNNELEVVKYLLQEGFDYTARDVRSDTPRDIAKNNDFTEIVELFPKDEVDVVSSIIDNQYLTFEQQFSTLQIGERPKFVFDICNFLCGVRSESIIKTLSDKDIDLLQFLSMTEHEMKSLGVIMPFQRNRILGGIYRFHKYPYHPKSLHIVPLNETYSNVDMATQILSAIKQLTAMEASLLYILKNYNIEKISKEKRPEIIRNVDNILKRVKMSRTLTKHLARKTNKWDIHVKPADLIAKGTTRYRVPWRKIMFSFGIVSLVFIYRIRK